MNNFLKTVLSLSLVFSLTGCMMAGPRDHHPHYDHHYDGHHAESHHPQHGHHPR